MKRRSILYNLPVVIVAFLVGLKRDSDNNISGLKSISNLDLKIDKHFKNCKCKICSQTSANSNLTSLLNRDTA